MYIKAEFKSLIMVDSRHPEHLKEMAEKMQKDSVMKVLMKAIEENYHVQVKEDENTKTMFIELFILEKSKWENFLNELKKFTFYNTHISKLLHNFFEAEEKKPA